MGFYRAWLGFAVMVAVMALARPAHDVAGDPHGRGRRPHLRRQRGLLLHRAQAHECGRRVAHHRAHADPDPRGGRSPLRRAAPRVDVLLTLVVIAGVALVVLGSSGRPEWSLFGDLLAVGALVTWTAYFVASKHARATLGALEYQAGVTLGAALVITPVALLVGPVPSHVETTGSGWRCSCCSPARSATCS